MKKIKHFAAILFVAAIFNFSACSKPKNQGENAGKSSDNTGNSILDRYSEKPAVTTGSQENTKTSGGSESSKTTAGGGAEKSEPGKNELTVNPKIQKLNAVYSKMSERFKSEVVIENPDEFLLELEDVLQAEKNYTSEDLPLYFLIDKKHNVGADYEPKNLTPLVQNDDYIINKTTLSLRPDAAQALSVLGRAAKQDGVMLDVSSTYRSYAYQENLFNYWVSVDGLEEAERESARPGTSQHQLGVAVDFGSIDDNYDKTPGGKWMYAHAAEYGWSLSFPKEYEDITGYRWECWHFRFIGVEACRFQKKWFNDVQQYMLEFIDEWKKTE